MPRAAFLTLSLLAAVACTAPPPTPQPAEPVSLDRLSLIRERGRLGCGIEPSVPGFSEVDATGRYRGFDIDICRAIAAAIFDAPDRVTFVPAPSMTEFLRRDNIDIVARRLTWEIRREGATGLLFGPVTFFDAQMVLVPKATGRRTVRDLAGVPICVAGGAPFEINLTQYFRAHAIPLQKVVMESPHAYDDIARALASGECRAYSGDLSDLGVVRAKMPQPDQFVFLPERLSDEPLAPVVRSDDVRFFGIVRWAIFALMAAEELGITTANVDGQLASDSLPIRRLLGVMPGNGQAIGLDERWAYRAIKAVGNYGELFERNVGRGSAIRLDRGPNRLARDGGLMFAPPLR